MERLIDPRSREINRVRSEIAVSSIQGGPKSLLCVLYVNMQKFEVKQYELFGTARVQSWLT